MPVEERRRIALRSQMAATWGEEAAQTLFELLTPAGHEMATRADLEAGFAAMDARFAVMDQRLIAMDQRLDERLGAMDRRFEERLGAMEQHLDARFAAADERLESAVNRMTATFERRISQAVTMQTRTLVWSQLAALVTVSALAFGLR